MARLCLRAALLTLAFALAIALLRDQPPDARLAADFGGCAACWQGVQAGTTPRAQAVTRLSAALGSRPILLNCFSQSEAACNVLLWVSPADSARRTQIQFAQDTAGTISSQSPGFTVGDALVTLDSLHQPLYKIAAGFQRSTLYLVMTFARSSVSLSASVACPTDYTALMRAPVDLLVVQPPDADASLPPTTLAFLRRTFSRLCEH